MNKNWILGLLIGILFTSCEPGDAIFVRCDSPALLLDQDSANTVCGSNFIFFNEDEFDTVKIQYNAVLRDFFQSNDIERDHYPFPVFIEYTDLSKGDPCRESLKDLVCIRQRKI